MLALSDRARNHCRPNVRFGGFPAYNLPIAQQRRDARDSENLGNGLRQPGGIAMLSGHFNGRYQEARNQDRICPPIDRLGRCVGPQAMSLISDRIAQIKRA